VNKRLPVPRSSEMVSTATTIFSPADDPSSHRAEVGDVQAEVVHLVEPRRTEMEMCSPPPKFRPSTDRNTRPVSAAFCVLMRVISGESDVKPCNEVPIKDPMVMDVPLDDCEVSNEGEQRIDVVVSQDDVKHDVTSSATETVKSKLPKLRPATVMENLGLDRRLNGAKLVKTLASKLKEVGVVCTMADVVKNTRWSAPPPPLDDCQQTKAVEVVQAEQRHAKLAPSSRTLMPRLGVGLIPPKLTPSRES